MAMVTAPKLVLTYREKCPWVELLKMEIARTDVSACYIVKVATVTIAWTTVVSTHQQRPVVRIPGRQFFPVKSMSMS